MGSVVISLDAELGWGFHHLDEPPSDVLRNARETWADLCRLFDEFAVPTTWAVTGHLLLDACSERHVDHPAGERYCTTSATGLSAGNIWFAEDLIEMVTNAQMHHEIASHGFTHVHFEHERMDEEFAARELEAAVDAAETLDLDVSSFVFPVNVVGYRDLLAEHSFECYRGVNPREASTGTAERWLLKLAGGAVGTPAPPLVTPTVDEYGLVNVPASLYLFNLEGRARRLLARTGEDPVVRQAKAGIDRAAHRDGVFHMWLHPHNVREPAHVDRLRDIVAHVARRRESHDLRVETMADVMRRTKRS